MPNILDYLNTISEAVYGKDVRQAIVDAISTCYEDGRAGVNDLEARRLIESAIGVNESQQADIDTLYAEIAEIQGGGGESSQESTTITLDTVIYDGGFVDSVTVNNNATKTYDVTFTQTFTEVPEVFACVAVQNSAAASYSKVTVGIVKAQTTTTGFRFFIANTSGATRSTTVVWAAFQPTTKEIDLDITIPSGDGMTESEVREITNPIQTAVDGVKTGYDGTVYSTPGEAVRTQINDLHVLIGDEPGTAIDASAIGYGEDSNVEDALDGLNERLDQIEQGGAGLSSEQKTTLINIVNAIGVFNVDTGQALLDAFNDAWLDYYTVRNVLTGCTSSNAATTVNKNSAYSATLTANEDYEIRTVSVTMGGVDITSTAYSNGVISISEVTGSLVITATAVDVNTWTDGVPYTLRWTDGYSIDNTTGEPVATSNRNVTQFLNCEGLHHITAPNVIGVYCYDSEKNYLGTAMNGESDGVRPLYIGSGYIRIVHNVKTCVVTPIVLPSIDETMTPVTGTKYQFDELTFEKDIWDTGNVVDSVSSNYISNFVRCYQFSTINITTSSRRALWFYDANKSPITGSRNVANSGNITIPSGAVFARVAFKIGNTKGYPCVVLAS